MKINATRRLTIFIVHLSPDVSSRRKITHNSFDLTHEIHMKEAIVNYQDTRRKEKNVNAIRKRILKFLAFAQLTNFN